MYRKHQLLKLFCVAVTAASVSGLVIGCSGSTDGSKDQDAGGGFVADGDTVGTIDLTVDNSSPSVGETTEFVVTVRDSNGKAVPGVKVTCDSEAGIGILEPTSGSEITTSTGHISGTIGCEVPGSLLFGCRLPVGGGNLRKFIPLRCSGTIPDGFSGFDGAAGGGLGSGGVVNEGTVSINSISFTDGPEANTYNIDITRNENCDGDTSTTDPEPYGQTSITVKLTNGTSSTINFDSYSFSVPSGETDGEDAVSSNIALTGTDFDVAPGATGTFTSFFTRISGVSTKIFVGTTGGVEHSAALQNGTRSATFTFFGTSASGEQVKVSGKVAISIGSFDRCD